MNEGIFSDQQRAVIVEAILQRLKDARIRLTRYAEREAVVRRMVDVVSQLCAENDVDISHVSHEAMTEEARNVYDAVMNRCRH